MTPRPFVFVNMASTLDGKITSAQREHPAFTSTEDRDEMDRLRADADAIIVGAHTLRSDAPLLHIRSEQARSYRQSLNKPMALLRVAVTRSGALSPEHRFFQGEHLGCIVATTKLCPLPVQETLRSHAEVWILGKENVDLLALLQRLHTRGIQKLLLEGGAELNWAFLQADLIDEVYLTLTPYMLGGTQAPTIVGGHGFSMAEKKAFELVSVRPYQNELFLRYRRRHS